MPLKLNISLSRKVGEANYGSRGATVGLEMEAEASLAHQPDQLYDQIAHFFSLARESVDRELAKPTTPLTHVVMGNGSAARLAREARGATANQLRAIHAIATERELDLMSELHRRYGVEEPAELSIVQASELIDALKSSVRKIGVSDDEPNLVAKIG